MLPTLTALQKRDPSSYPPDWLCALCHSAPEDLDHLWTCPYIIPDASPRLIFHKLMLSFHDKCITQFSDTSPLSDQFLLEFSALDYSQEHVPKSSSVSSSLSSSVLFSSTSGSSLATVLRILGLPGYPLQ
ncbi:unnamed protein product [Rhizophagus irregularis]|nr:unnamed protein product [Rhizophagus irregularis]